MKLELVAWKAFYSDGASYNSRDFNWKAIPTKNLAVLKKFYKAFDENGKRIIDKESGKQFFYELSYGTPVCCLTVDELQNYKKLPKAIKFMEQDLDQITNFLKIAEDDEDEPWQTNLTTTNQESL